MIVTRGIGHGTIIGAIVAAGLCLGSAATVYTLPNAAYIVAVGSEVRLVIQEEAMEMRTVIVPEEQRVVAVEETPRLAAVESENRVAVVEV